MPVPKPKTGEDLQTYVSRCIPILKKLDPKRPDAQVKAICYSTWRKAHGQKIRSKGKGRGKQRGEGKGPIGIPVRAKMTTEIWELDEEGKVVKDG